MKAGFQVSLSFAFFLFFAGLKAQVNSLELNLEKEKMYTPYMMWRHSGSEGLAEFKKDRPHDYLRELWYYSESFYIKRDYFQVGASIDPAMIPIDRYESSRLESKEAVVVLPGYKDVLVLLPINKLIFKP